MSAMSGVWSAHPGWSLGDGGAVVSAEYDDGRPMAARGLDRLEQREGGHHIEFCVYKWHSVIGVTDVTVSDWDADSRDAGQAWGFEVSGCFFHSTQNALRLSSVGMEFEEHFYGHTGGCAPELGFRVEVRIDWPSRNLYFALNSGPYHCAPVQLPPGVTHLSPWVHNNSMDECKAQIVHLCCVDAGPPPDRKPPPIAVVRPLMRAGSSHNLAGPSDWHARRPFRCQGMGVKTAAGKAKRPQRKRKSSGDSSDYSSEEEEKERRRLAEEETQEAKEAKEAAEAEEMEEAAGRDREEAEGRATDDDDKEEVKDEDVEANKLNEKEQQEYERLRRAYTQPQPRTSVELSRFTLRATGPRFLPPVIEAKHPRGKLILKRLESDEKKQLFKRALGLLRQIHLWWTQNLPLPYPQIQCHADPDLIESNQHNPIDLIGGGSVVQEAIDVDALEDIGTFYDRLLAEEPKEDEDAREDA